MDAQSPILVKRLVKRYGETLAADQISFEVRPGEIFGMVGPNGAGKTTTIECVEGLRRPDGGEVRTLGMDPWGERRTLMAHIGVQLQESALPARIKVCEAMALFGSFYRRSVDRDLLLDQLDLSAKRGTPFAKLSGGQKQRLFIALALLHDPDVIFLDELTTGLDPQARHAMWDLVRAIRAQGKTIFLSTHFMEEAERLCDRVAILDKGRLIALDTPQGLIRSLGADKRLVFDLVQDAAPKAREILQDVPPVARVEANRTHLVVYGKGERFAGAVVSALEGAGIAVHDLRTEQPNLEDVFLSLTGRAMRD